jgi:N-acetylglutamate synthase-like GNAT family acetyltransferase
MVIKTADMSHVDEIFALTTKCFKTYQQSIGKDCHLEALNEDRQRVVDDIKNKTIYICVENDEIIGSARVYSNQFCAVVSRFGIDPKILSKGVGSQLMQRIIDDLKEKSVAQASLFTALENKSSVTFYQKFGFEIESTIFENGYERAFMVVKFSK